MPERYWLRFTTRHRHGPPTQDLVYYQREGDGDRWRLYYGKAGRRRSVGTDSTRMVEYQVDLAKSEGRFVRHEPDQGRMFNPLVRGYSRRAISSTISREMHAGRDQDQAVAIALSTARRAYRARHPRGRLPANLRRNPSMMPNPYPGRTIRRMPRGAQSLGGGFVLVPFTENGARQWALYGDGDLLGTYASRLSAYHAAERARTTHEAALRRIYGNPTDIEPMPDKPGRYLLRDRETGRIVASGRDQRNAIRQASDRDIAERRRRARPRRNPSEGDWIDILVPIVAVWALIQTGRLKTT